MSKSRNSNERRTTPRGRVGRFHFAPLRRGPARYRLMADLADGRRILVRMGHSVREINRSPLPINEAIRNEVVGLTAERRVGPPSIAHWEIIDGSDRRR